MGRTKEADRDRSIRVPVTDEELSLVQRLAGLVPVAAYLRDLIMREAKAKGLIKATKGRTMR